MTEGKEQIKMVIVGEAGVGKTSIMQVYSEGIFYSNQTTTIGATCCEKDVTVNNINYMLSIWDTAGQESYRTIVPMYFRGASIAVVVFDVTNRKSLESIDFWVKTLNENLEYNVIIALCANKIDLESDRVVDDDEILSISNEQGVPVFYTSASTGVGINSLFHYLLSQLSSSPNDKENKNDLKLVNVSEKDHKGNKKCIC